MTNIEKLISDFEQKNNCLINAHWAYNGIDPDTRRYLKIDMYVDHLILMWSRVMTDSFEKVPDPDRAKYYIVCSDHMIGSDIYNALDELSSVLLTKTIKELGG